MIININLNGKRIDIDLSTEDVGRIKSKTQERNLAIVKKVWKDNQDIPMPLVVLMCERLTQHWIHVANEYATNQYLKTKEEK